MKSSIPGRLAVFLCQGPHPCEHHVRQAEEVYKEILDIQKHEREVEAQEALERVANKEKIR
jgi:hypothetical protein